MQTYGNFNKNFVFENFRDDRTLNKKFCHLGEFDYFKIEFFKGKKF